MIEIKDISGNKLTVSISQDCERVEELMKSDHVALSWNSDVKQILPVGSYIEYKGERFSLLEPYSPEQKDELEFLYKPIFQSKMMAWAKTPFFMYTNGAKETDWSLTDNPANFMSRVVLSIKEETGEVWTYGVDASLPASTTLSLQSIDIFSALNQIAGAFNTEWWVDKTQKIIHLSKASFGDPITLEVGKNINTPSVTSTKENYFTRFYAFGSTRNITQEYKGANVNNLVNKRLTLDPEKYPLGYKDIRPDLKDGEIFSKVLIFDDIYPSSKLVISEVRCRLMWVLNDGNKIQIGTDSEGNPVYDQYSVWYFRIKGFEFNNTTYDEDENPDGMKLEDKNLSVRFESGPLSGREFELTYHDEDKTESSSDGNTFLVKEGDYEINYTKEESYIIPDMISLVPVDGNNVILFNLRTPKEYTDSAYVELENALNKEMERLSSDLNNYQFSSNPVEFHSNNPVLSIGRSVTYKNGEYSFSTRVIKLTTKLDFEHEQEITIGNEQIKGNTQELKEEVISANKDLNLLQSLNNMTTALQQSYIRAQDMMMQGFAAIKDMWRFDPADPNTIYSKYNVWTEGGFSAMGRNTESGGGGGVTSLGGLSNVGSWADDTPKQDRILVQKAGSLNWTEKLLSDISGLDVTALADYLSSNHYITESKATELINSSIHTHDNLVLLNTITELMVQKWNSAYSWGDHSKAGYLLKSDFNDLFQVTQKDGVKTLQVKANIFTELAISAFGKSDSQGGGGSSYGRLDSWSDYNPNAGYVLSAVLGMDLKTKLDKVPVPTSADSGKYVRVNTYGEYTLSKPLWSDITSVPTTLAGYGITDAYTKISSDGRYVLKSGDTMTGNLIIANGTNSRLSLRDNDAYLLQEYFNGGFGLYLYGAIGVLANKMYVGTTTNCYEVWHQGNDDILLRGRGVLKDNINWNNLLNPGYYLNQTGDGAGYENLATIYSNDIIWGSGNYVSQIQHSMNNSDMYIRQRWNGAWSGWKRFAFNGEEFSGTNGRFSSALTVSGHATFSGSVFTYSDLNILRKIYLNNELDGSTMTLGGHHLNFGGSGYANMQYCFDPCHGTSGATESSVYIRNYNASDEPSVTHSFLSNGNAVHTGTLTAAQGIFSQLIVGEGNNEINNTSNGNIWIGYRNTSIVYLGYGNRTGTGKYALATNDDGCVYMPNGARIFNGSISIGNFSGGDPTVFVSYGQSWFRIINNNAPISITANGSTTDSQIYLNTNGNVSIGGSYNSYKLNVTGEIFSTGWLRTSGSYGWYSNTFGGGIYMYDSVWLRVYGAKKFYVSNTSGDSISTNGGFYSFGYAGSSWSDGYGALGVEIANNNSQTPLIVASRTGTGPVSLGDNRLFSLELLNSGSAMRYSFKGIWAFEMQYNGNFVVKGGITAYSTSDIRLKRNLRPINNAGNLLKSLGGIFEYDYSGEALKLNPNLPKHDYGLIAQNVRPVLPQYVNTIHNTEYLGIQYEKFIPLLIASQIEQMSEVEILKKRVSELESEVIRLKNK